jgi:hypothetical protein
MRSCFASGHCSDGCECVAYQPVVVVDDIFLFPAVGQPAAINFAQAALTNDLVGQALSEWCDNMASCADDTQRQKILPS